MSRHKVALHVVSSQRFPPRPRVLFGWPEAHPIAAGNGGHIGRRVCWLGISLNRSSQCHSVGTRGTHETSSANPTDMKRITPGGIVIGRLHPERRGGGARRKNAHKEEVR